MNKLKTKNLTVSLEFSVKFELMKNSTKNFTHTMNTQLLTGISATNANY